MTEILSFRRTVFSVLVLFLSFGVYWTDLYKWLDLEFFEPDNKMAAEDSQAASSIYDLKYIDIDGNKQSMEKFKGHVLIIVNVASKCGFTGSNYAQLQELYDKYSESKGLRILAFPSNQFANQEPEDEAGIKEFACSRFKVTFEMTKKIDVNGDNAHPIWKFLKSKQGGILGSWTKWNFTKFLIDKSGNVVKRYAPTTTPKSFEDELIKYLE